LNIIQRGFMPTESANTSWTKLTARTRKQAQVAYGRELCLSHWICYAQSHLLAKIWHMAQVFPAPRECVWQLTLAVAWYIWQGATFVESPFLHYNAKGTRGLGVIRHSCKMLCPPSQPNVNPRPKRVVGDGGMASVPGSARAPREPPSGEDTEDDEVPVLCMRSGQ